MNRLIPAFMLGAFFLIILQSCTKDPILADLPKCVQSLVKDLKKGPVDNPPATLYSYTFEGETVYYVPGGCCDVFSTLYNSDCEVICHPDGGFTGWGDGQCINFWSEATDEKLLLEDE